MQRLAELVGALIILIGLFAGQAAVDTANAKISQRIPPWPQLTEELVGVKRDDISDAGDEPLLVYSLWFVELGSAVDGFLPRTWQVERDNQSAGVWQVFTKENVLELAGDFSSSVAINLGRRCSRQVSESGADVVLFTVANRAVAVTMAEWAVGVNNPAHDRYLRILLEPGPVDDGKGAVATTVRLEYASSEGTVASTELSAFLGERPIRPLAIVSQTGEASGQDFQKYYAVYAAVLVVASGQSPCDQSVISAGSIGGLRKLFFGPDRVEQGEPPACAVELTGPVRSPGYRIELNQPLGNWGRATATLEGHQTDVDFSAGFTVWCYQRLGFTARVYRPLESDSGFGIRLGITDTTVFWGPVELKLTCLPLQMTAGEMAVSWSAHADFTFLLRHRTWEASYRAVYESDELRSAVRIAKRVGANLGIELAHNHSADRGSFLSLGIEFWSR